MTSERRRDLPPKSHSINALDKPAITATIRRPLDREMLPLDWRQMGRQAGLPRRKNVPVQQVRGTKVTHRAAQFDCHPDGERSKEKQSLKPSGG